jgi:hypothetical protein
MRISLLIGVLSNPISARSGTIPPAVVPVVAWNGA